MQITQVVLIALLKVSCIQSTTLTAFTKRENISTLSMYPLGLHFVAPTSLHCARICWTSTNCSSFFYVESNGNCSLNRWPYYQALNQSYLPFVGSFYSINLPCDPATGFKIITSGDVKVCVFVSTDSRSYFGARSACQGKNSKLYTPKNPEKLQILLTIGNVDKQTRWFGLNDLKTEDVFVWEDDGSVLTADWRRTLFKTNQTVISNYEDCVELHFTTGNANDNNCNTTFRYVCEINYV